MCTFCHNVVWRYLPLATSLSLPFLPLATSHFLLLLCWPFLLWPFLQLAISPPCWFSAGCSSPCYSSPLQLLPLAVPPFATPLVGANPRVLSTSRSSKIVLYLKAQFTLICTVIILTTFQTIQLMLQQLEAAPVTAWSCFSWRLYVQLRTETKCAHTFSYFNFIIWGM